MRQSFKTRCDLLHCPYQRGCELTLRNHSILAELGYSRATGFFAQPGIVPDPDPPHSLFLVWGCVVEDPQSTNRITFIFQQLRDFDLTITYRKKYTTALFSRPDFTIEPVWCICRMSVPSV